MKLTIDREVLLQGVSRTIGVVDRRGFQPVLTHFLLAAADNQVTIAATDLEVSFRGTYPAQVAKPGALAIPARHFHSIIKELPGSELEISATDSGLLHLAVSVGGSRYKFSGLSADEFPPIPEMPEHPMVMVESRLLRDMISKTIFSVSKDDAQYSIAGICWERHETPDGYSLRLVSTDGHRLTLIERPMPQMEHFPLAQGMLVPRKGMEELSRLLAEEKQVGLGLSNKSLAVQADSRCLFIHLPDKKFPDYQRIIPENIAYRFVLDRRTFRDILRRLSLLSTERFRGVVLQFGPDRLEAHISQAGIGEGREIMPVSMEQGDPGGLPLTIGFNAPYLLDILGAMTGSEVVMEIDTPDRPCRITAADDPNYFGIIMPMSL